MFKENLILVCIEAQGLIPPRDIKGEQTKKQTKLSSKKTKRYKATIILNLLFQLFGDLRLIHICDVL